MAILITRNYDIEASHHLTAGVAETDDERRDHSHRYQVKVQVAGPLDDSGLVVEFTALDKVILPVLRLASHHGGLNTLNDRCSTAAAALVAANPTTERLAAWLGERLSGIVASASGDGRHLRLAGVTVEQDGRGAAHWAP